MALVAYPFLGSLLAACTDETIQMFVDGRGSSLMDVWVDAFGALTGIILLVLGHHLRKKT
jgi:VanZ family protein